MRLYGTIVLCCETNSAVRGQDPLVLAAGVGWLGVVFSSASPILSSVYFIFLFTLPSLLETAWYDCDIVDLSIKLQNGLPFVYFPITSYLKWCPTFSFDSLKILSSIRFALTRPTVNINVDTTHRPVHWGREGCGGMRSQPTSGTMFQAIMQRFGFPESNFTPAFWPEFGIFVRNARNAHPPVLKLQSKTRDFQFSLW